jgi:branched-chain amino acid transport system permease protein
MAELLIRLQGHGLTIVIIEHDMKLIERAVLSHPDVIAAYLGERQHEAA